MGIGEDDVHIYTYVHTRNRVDVATQEEEVYNDIGELGIRSGRQTQ